MKIMNSKKQAYINILTDFRLEKAELEEKKHQLNKALNELDITIYRIEGMLETESQNTKIESDSFSKIGIIKACIKFLEIEKCNQSTTEIVNALNNGGLEVQKGSVAAALHRENKSNKPKILKTQMAKWGLSKWYPDESLETDTNKKLDAMSDSVG